MAVSAAKGFGDASRARSCPTDDADTVAAALRVAARAFVAMADNGALCGAVGRAAAMVTSSLRAGGKLMLCGNGGSAAATQHWATELVGRFRYDQPGLAAIALTALVNDYGYERVFARQVEALGHAICALIEAALFPRPA